MDEFSTEMGSGLINPDIAGKEIWKASFSDLQKSSEHSVICLECASGYLGLTTFNCYDNIMLLLETDAKDRQFKRFDGNTLEYCTVDKIDYEHCTKINNNLYVTDIPLTICQMLQFRCHEFHLYEAIDDLVTFHPELIAETEELAKKLGVLDVLKESYDLAEEAYREDNE